MDRLFDSPIHRLDGTPTTLAEHRGKVLLIVNVASHCGFTPQYAGLRELQSKFAERGFSVLGFPCNQFGAQEPGSAAEIGAFCTGKYDVNFPMYEKIEVNGAGAHAIFEHLRAAAPGILGTTSVKWNFTKFLVDRAGRVVRRFGPTASPASLEEPIRALLEEPVVAAAP